MFPNPINLADLDGTNGFVINGINSGDYSGSSVSNAGDINGDGVDDLIIGAPNANNDAGESYVIFGDENLGSNGSFELSNLNSNNGFILKGINSDSGIGFNEGDFSGSSVSNGGDLNGDGFNELIIGAPFANNPNANNGPYDAGETYIVFGGNNISSPIELSDLNGSNGFVLKGIDGNYSEQTFLSSADISGFSVSNAGDVNGDGVDDLIIGAPGLSSSPGKSYIVFGDNNVGSTGNLELSDLNGDNGFVIDATGQYDLARTGVSVSNLGDLNGDGFDDVIIGSAVYEPFAGPGYFIGGRESYVIFGGNNVGSTGSVPISDLNGQNGFVINGVEQSIRLVSNAGDINGDGLDDLIIGVPDDSNNSDTPGKTFVVFGTSNIGNSGNLELSQLNGTNGFVINGIDSYDRAGSSVSNAVDINGDGFDDLIIDADESEESYVVLGSSNIGSNGSLELSNLNGTNGFVINGSGINSFRTTVSNAGDVNNDGIDDLIIGKPFADPNGDFGAGESYVIFGVEESAPNKIEGTAGNDIIDGTLGADEIHALAGNVTVRGLARDDTITRGKGRDALFGNNGNDVIDGGDGDDTIWGQADNDSVDGGNGRDRVLGNNGNDTLLGGNGIDTLFGGNGNDSILGNAGNDQIIGNAGDDSLFGGLDNDILFGFAGADELFGGEGNDVLWGQADNDFLAGGTGTDVLYGNNGNDVLVGGDGTDSLFGNLGNDSLEGNTGNDILFGNDGNDTLFGGLGNDTLWSGSGSDFFELTRGADVGVERVKDYQDGVDKFLLSDRFNLGSLEFSDLTISQNGNNAQIIITQNNQLLAIIDNINAGQLNSDDFVIN